MRRRTPAREFAAIGARPAAGQATHDRSQPTTQRQSRDRLPARSDPGLLREVVGGVSIVHELARQASHEGVVRENLFGVDAQRPW